MSRRVFFASVAAHVVLIAALARHVSVSPHVDGTGDPRHGSTVAEQVTGAFLLDAPTEPETAEVKLSLPTSDTKIAPITEAAPISFAPTVNAPAIAPITFPMLARIPSITTAIPAPERTPKDRTPPGRMVATKDGNSPRKGVASSGHGGTPSNTGGTGHGGNGTGYVPPRFLVRYKPAYPEEARASRMEGVVLLLVTVDSKGKVTDAIVQESCGHLLLDRVAMQAVRTWRFDPAKQNGVDVAAEVEVPVRFLYSEHRSNRA